MTDPFFNHDEMIPNELLEESFLSEEEDGYYDAFNKETFGDDVWEGEDWEENHEKLAEIAELSRHHFDDDDELSSRIANFILDDDDIQGKLDKLNEDYSDDENKSDGKMYNCFGQDDLPLLWSSSPSQPLEQHKPKPRPPPGFVENPPAQLPPLPQDLLKMVNLKKIFTVEEVERDLRKPQPNSVRLEDVERNIISSAPVNPMVVRSELVQDAGGVLVRPDNLGPQPVGTIVRFLASLSQFLLPSVPPYVLPSLLLQQQNNRTVGVPYGIHPPNVNSVRDLDIKVDPYDGLMTYREKQWVTSIQLIQISANPTYQNDYYYKMYQHRQSGGRKINSLKIRDRYAGSTSKSMQYTPQQFENSLGKIQACSVMAPRKIIDMDIVEKTSLDSSTSQASSSSKKLKQILLEIEQMYSDVLKAEEVISPLLNAQNDSSVDPKALFMKTVKTLLTKDNLSSVLNIRKGKTLVLRVLSHPEVCSELARALLNLLPGVAESDREEALLRALPSVRHYLHSATPLELIQLAVFLQPHLQFLMYNKFGVSVIANILERGEALRLDSGMEKWSEFLGKLGRSMTPSKEPERPVVGLPAPVLSFLLSKARPPLSPSETYLLTRSLANLASKQS